MSPMAECVEKEPNGAGERPEVEAQGVAGPRQTEEGDRNELATRGSQRSPRRLSRS